jgi:hypothetical protein
MRINNANIYITLFIKHVIWVAHNTCYWTTVEEYCWILINSFKNCITKLLKFIKAFKAVWIKVPKSSIILGFNIIVSKAWIIRWVKVLRVRVLTVKVLRVRVLRVRVLRVTMFGLIMLFEAFLQRKQSVTFRTIKVGGSFKMLF